MSGHIDDFVAALSGGRGELDAWLEVNSEAEVRAAINGYTEQLLCERDRALDEVRKQLQIAEKFYQVALAERNFERANVANLMEALNRRA